LYKGFSILETYIFSEAGNEDDGGLVGNTMSDSSFVGI